MAAAASAASALVGLLFTSTFLLSAAASLPSSAACSSLLVNFSPCLPYVSSPPNKLSDSVPSHCCDAFSSAFESEHCTCLCYLIRRPLLLGFPLDRSRVLSLSSICPPMNASSARHGSLEVLCSGLPIPPLHPPHNPLRNHTDTGSESPKPHVDLSPDTAPSSTSLPPEAAENSLTPPSYPSDSAVRSPPPPSFPPEYNNSITPPPSSSAEHIGSSAAKQILNSTSWILSGILIFLVPIFTHL